MARSDPPMGGPFVAELARRLQGRTSALALPLTWIEQRLSESGSTIEQLVQSENQQQAADQVSVSNSIGSLRFLGALDWRKFVESMSVVEQTLLEDPAGVYGRQDFATRDRYRHVDRSARATHAPPEARDRAQSDRARASNERGTRVLSQSKPCRLLHRRRRARRSSSARSKRAFSAAERVRRACGKHRSRFIWARSRCSTAAFAAIFTWLPIARASSLGAAGDRRSGVLAGSQLAVSLVNLLATLLTTPRPLPRMDFSRGIPAECRTLVVVPTMLLSAAEHGRADRGS